MPGSQADRPHTGRGEVAEGCHLHPSQARWGYSSQCTELKAVLTLLEEPPTPKLYIEVIPPPPQSLTLLLSPAACHILTSAKCWMPLSSSHAKAHPCLFHHTSPWTTW